ncbi:MAG: amino acid transporter substrate-binding protein [Naasia sp.]|nr:amino acid transporter substrate-binding protein [Naasia sp.]
MSVFAKAQASRSRTLKTVVNGVAVLGVSALFLSACASPAAEAPETNEPAPAAEDMTLKIGTALPQTGGLAFLGPPEEAGVGYATKLINEATADTGLTVEVTYGDSGDTDNKAYETEIPRLLGEDVSAIIGAASSSTSLQFIDDVTGAGVIQFSPANTSDAFTTYDDNGLYWRTAPSDVLQGAVLGNLIAEDGVQSLGMIVQNDSYGTGLAKYVQEAFEEGGGEVVAQPTYNVGDTSFDSQISEVLAADPDAIVLITFDEVFTILPSLAGQFPADKLYFVDGNLKNFGDEVPAGSITGSKGTLPGLTIDTIADFTDALQEYATTEGNGELTDFSYAAESFDAVNLLALAALAAGSIDGEEIAGKLQEVSGGAGDGEKCTTFADCAAIILDGGTADYDGISGPITFDENGDPTEASIGIYQYGEDNNYVAYEG